MSNNIGAPKPKPRGKKKRFEYMRDHFRYYTMNSWNQGHAPARNIKLGHIEIPKVADECAWDMIGVDDYMQLTDMRDPLDMWQREWNDSYQWGGNGRSGGYIVVYTGQREPSGVQSFCRHCGQQNFATVVEPITDEADLEGRLHAYVITHNSWVLHTYPEQTEVKEIGLPAERVVELVRQWRAEWRSKYKDGKPHVTLGNRCGRCGEDARYNVENHTKVTCWPGRGVFEELADKELTYEQAKEDLDLDHAFDVIYSFDVAVDQAIANFISFCETHKVEDQEVLVKKTIKVPVEV